MSAASRWPLILPLLALALAGAAAPAAHADDKSQTSATAWRAADNCARQAFHKFPDYTAQSNAKREQYRRSCLRLAELPAPDGPGD